VSRPKLFDSHCHLQFAAYREDGGRVLRDALEAEVWMIAVGTQSQTSERAVGLAEETPAGLYAAIGLHPNHLYAMRFDEEETVVQTRAERFDLACYSELARSEKVAAVGECGIDLYHLPEGVAREEAVKTQIEQFEIQLDFADSKNLPVIVHCRDAHEEIIRALKRKSANGLKKRGVIHSFTGDWETAKRYLDLGFLIGLNGIITFPPKKSDPTVQAKLLEAARELPADMFLLETDAPYLAPVPHRGERNLPRYVREVAARLAEIRGVSFEATAEQGVANALRLFDKVRA
jgi:TatD DNase family protein